MFFKKCGKFLFATRKNSQALDFAVAYTDCISAYAGSIPTPASAYRPFLEAKLPSAVASISEEPIKAIQTEAKLERVTGICSKPTQNCSKIEQPGWHATHYTDW